MQTSKVDAAPDEWDRHWGETARINALNPAQVYRRKLIFGALDLETAPSPVRLLELGSGSGEFAGDVHRKRPDAEIVGLDLSSVAIEIARRSVPNARFLQQDFTKPMKLEEAYRNWATHTVCSEVLEHLDDPLAALRSVRPFLAEGGRLIVTVPGGPMSAFDRHIGHRRHFTPQLLETLLTDAGFIVTDLRGAGFPFFNLYRLAVVARGKKLVKDAADKDETTLPRTARAAIRVFSSLFALNSSKTRLGWQLVAVGVRGP